MHDYFGTPDGGGRVVLTLADARQWPLVCAFVSSRFPFQAVRPTIPFRTLGVHPGHRVVQTFSLVRAWSRYRPEPADVSVFSGSYAPLSARRQAGGATLLYCHTPPRFAYDQRHYFRRSVPLWQRPLLDALVAYLRPRYETAVRQMDVVIANSVNVQRRLKSYIGCESTVIYPPCDIQHFRWKDQQGYFLSTARLDPLKRVDRIVKAFMDLPDERLIVVSGGSEETRLRRMARNAPNIEFRGWVGSDELRSLIGSCLATIYVPMDEDFGISPVESMSAGKPVIGTAEGGLLETVVDGVTGLLIDSKVPVSALVAAIKAMTKERALAMRNACEHRAGAFAKEKFVEAMDRTIAAYTKGGHGESIHGA